MLVALVMTEAQSENFAYRIKREAGGARARLADLWTRRWFRWISYALLGLFLAIFLIWILFARNLPDAKALLDYEPPLPTMVRGVDGEVVYSFARERRVQLQYQDFPKKLIDAYLAAEDKTFFSHGGIDYPGIVGALIDNIGNIGSDQRARGASTITQQVAKNILVGNERSITRKLREAILAYRIEGVLSKEQILELYLNEIPLGRRSYGVQAAAQAYFAKDVGELELHEVAFLAILPKAPERYGRKQNEAQAIARRNWVLLQMQENGWITADQRAVASAEPLGLVPQSATVWPKGTGYFTEEVRRQLLERYGENAEDGPYGVYSGGLWVRTSLDLEKQSAARDALRGGLLRYAAGQGWRKPIATIKLEDGPWQGQLASSNITIDYLNWRVGVVVERRGANATIGFADGDTAPLIGLPNALKAGDVIAAAPAGGKAWAVRTVPEVSGGFIAQDTHSGRILAMQGGFDSGLGSFNRATQAERQPGSTIKPFVYAAALDQGMTPATKIVDGTFCVYQSASLGRKCFRNFGGARGAGSQTMRWGLEQSRNLMTVRAANDTGMENVVKTIAKMGIGEYDPYLAFALGAGDTTVLRLTNAYSMLVNHGRELKPTVIDYVQDRRGKVIWRADERKCVKCNMLRWDGKPMPRPKRVGKQLMDAMTAYQVVHMLEGVIQRGTATNLRSLDRPLFGKTGTSTGPTNAWFVGGTPDVVAGLYIGFDTPRPMGGYVQGGSTAAPIFKAFAMKGLNDNISQVPFRAPAGIRMVRIDRVSGRRVFGGFPSDDPKSSVIWEAFKPDTEPKRSIREEEMAAAASTRTRAAPKRSAERAAPRKSEDAPARAQQPNDFAGDQGGIY